MGRSRSDRREAEGRSAARSTSAKVRSCWEKVTWPGANQQQPPPPSLLLSAAPQRRRAAAGKPKRPGCCWRTSKGGKGGGVCAKWSKFRSLHSPPPPVSPLDPGRTLGGRGALELLWEGESAESRTLATCTSLEVVASRAAAGGLPSFLLLVFDISREGKRIIRCSSSSTDAVSSGFKALHKPELLVVLNNNLPR